VTSVIDCDENETPEFKETNNAQGQGQGGGMDFHSDEEKSVKSEPEKIDPLHNLLLENMTNSEIEEQTQIIDNFIDEI
jgi:hypothetical protein